MGVVADFSQPDAGRAIQRLPLVAQPEVMRAALPPGDLSATGSATLKTYIDGVGPAWRWISAFDPG
jgi:hypothetical protein